MVFNGKDRKNYKDKYPEIEIYFAVDWQVTKFKGNTMIEVNPMIGVWYITFKKLDALLENAPFHSYQQRMSDNRGNAKGSYVVNFLNNEFKKLI